ncbi:hypothetical protein BCR43DRAFT_121273 [Syncephalastrum racemosum]|uniref:Uncharacterized protein n=1 Tax=Syncephalastrum racemosum TaxID=13706 RepID=A0A1X2GZT3_SYNRA|nr:hypothetical protein BCR43DRAFT_121273 [Syncephalastrum racemosum]
MYVPFSVMHDQTLRYVELCLCISFPLALTLAFLSITGSGGQNVCACIQEVQEFSMTSSYMFIDIAVLLCSALLCNQIDKSTMNVRVLTYYHHWDS